MLPSDRAATPAAARRRGALRLATALLLTLPACELSQSGPILTPGEYHFGNLVHGQMAEHTWLLSAAVPRAFHVQYIRVPCSCALPELIVTTPGGARRTTTYIAAEQPFAIAAGERVELRLGFDSDMKLARDWEENFQTVVFTDLPEQPQVPFKFQATIRVPMLITPGPEVDFGALNEHQVATTTVTLAPRDGQDFKVRDIIGVDSIMTPDGPKDREVPLAGIKLTPTRLEGGAWRYLVESPPGRTYDEQGRFFRRVRFKTDLPGDYKLEIQFRAMRVPAITIEPVDKISFRRVDPDHPAEESVSLRQNVPGDLFTASLDHIELTVEGKSAEPGDHFTVRLEQLPAVRVVRLFVRYEKPLAGRYFRGRIHLKTNLKDAPTLFVEMVGFHDH